MKAERRANAPSISASVMESTYAQRPIGAGSGARRIPSRWTTISSRARLLALGGVASASAGGFGGARGSATLLVKFGGGGGP